MEALGEIAGATSELKHIVPCELFIFVRGDRAFIVGILIEPACLLRLSLGVRGHLLQFADDSQRAN
jgi:hypothetical protein